VNNICAVAVAVAVAVAGTKIRMGGMLLFIFGWGKV
jgi:uncharacterized membrane protein